MTKRKNLLLCACVAICFIAPMHAQITTASVNGTVTDATGAGVPNASLRLEETSRGVSRTAVSSAAGRFTFDFVTIGTYRLTVSAAGFSDKVRTGLNLSSGQDLDLPVQLDVQQQSQSVEVSAAPADIDTSTAVQIATLNDAQVHDLPVAHLDWSNLLTDSPGTTKPPFITNLNSTSPLGSGININGLPSAGYNFTVDGTNNSSDVNFPAFNVYQGVSLINTVNNDSIQELTTQRAIAPAIVGGGMSGNINIVTKSGTNSYHGSLHELNETAAYDARNQLLSTKPGTTYNDYGGSIGMPIIRNKLFFFGAFEMASVHTAKLISGGVPSPFLRSTAPAVYAPLLNLFPLAPQPSDPKGTTSQYSGPGTAKQEDNNGVYRMDYYVNSNNILFGRWVRSRPYAYSPALIAANPRQFFDRGDAVNFTYTHSGARFAENTRVALNRIMMIRTDALTDPNFANVTFGWSSVGAKQETDWGSYYTVQEAVVYSRGKQTIQFGGIFERQVTLNEQFSPTAITYANLAQFTANTPSAFGLQLQAYPAGEPSWQNTRNQYGVFVQDDIKLTSTLTVNLGFRYDYFTVPKEVNNRIFNRATDPILGPGYGPIINKWYDPDYTSIQPRIGLAYNIGGKGKTVIRAGFSKMAMGPTFFSTVKEDINFAGKNGGILPFNVTLNGTQTAASGLRYPFNSFNYVSQYNTIQTAGIISANSTVQAVINPHWPNPYSLQWMVGIQQALPWGTTLEVDYNGNRGLHETLQYNVNYPDRTTNIAPQPTYGRQTLYTPDDRSKYAALQMSLRKRVQNGFQISTGLTYARVSAFSGADVLNATPIQEPTNRLADWGPTPFDIKLRSVTHAIWDIPLAKWAGATSRVSKLALDGWQISGVLSLQTGLPANITNSSSVNTADRPDSAGISPYTGLGGVQYLKASAFSQIPLSGSGGQQKRPGNLSFDAVRIPGSEILDLSLSKSFYVREGMRLQLRADTFNTLNHTNLNLLIGTINTSNFGQLTQASARAMQLGARFSF